MEQSAAFGREPASTVWSAYRDFGYSSNGALEAEMNTLLNDVPGLAVAEDERQRIVALHQRLHAAQESVLRDIEAGERASEAGLRRLTEIRVEFFRTCDAILGQERFEQLFGDDLATTVAEFTALSEAAER